MFYTVGIAEFAGLEIAALANDGQHRRVENTGLKMTDEVARVDNARLQNGGLENDGLEFGGL